MTTFIDDHKQLWGVEPICAQLPIAPSTYYAAKSRPPSARSISDAEMKTKVLKVYEDNYKVYGAVTSVGSKGDSYDNALAETVNGLYKTELIYRQGPWRNADEVELATLRWVDWWNHRRLHGACGDIPPLEFEANYYRGLEEASQQESTPTV